MTIPTVTNISMYCLRAVRQSLIAGSVMASLVVSVADDSEAAVATEEPAKASSRTIKVAGVLFEPVRTGDYKAKNFRHAEELVREAAAGGAELVCTYEQFLDGYGRDANKMQGASNPQAARCEVIGESVYVRRLGELAEELHIAIAAGVAIREGEDTFNSTLLFDNTGKLIGIYRKTHNAGKYARWFAPLTAKDKKAACPSFPIGVGRVSVKICNDRRFPETTDYMIENGCELLLCPAYGTYSADRLLSDTKRFGMWAVFVHPNGCQFIDSGEVVLERRRMRGERCVVLHSVQFRSPLFRSPIANGGSN